MGVAISRPTPPPAHTPVAVVMKPTVAPPRAVEAAVTHVRVTPALVPAVLPPVLYLSNHTKAEIATVLKQVLVVSNCLPVPELIDLVAEFAAYDGRFTIHVVDRRGPRRTGSSHPRHLTLFRGHYPQHGAGTLGFQGHCMGRNSTLTFAQAHAQPHAPRTWYMDVSPPPIVRPEDVCLLLGTERYASLVHTIDVNSFMGPYSTYFAPRHTYQHVKNAHGICFVPADGSVLGLHRIFRIRNGHRVKGKPEIIAGFASGAGEEGWKDGAMSDGNRLASPLGLACSADSKFVLIADAGNNAIRRLTLHSKQRSSSGGNSNDEKSVPVLDTVAKSTTVDLSGADCGSPMRRPQAIAFELLNSKRELDGVASGKLQFTTLSGANPFIAPPPVTTVVATAAAAAAPAAK